MTAIAARRSDARLLGRWIAARVRMTLRSPRALGFTFAFPLVLVTLFGAINERRRGLGRTAPTCRSRSTTRPRSASSASPPPVTRAWSSASPPRARPGLLKRVRGTPLPVAGLPRLLERRRDAHRASRSVLAAVRSSRCRRFGVDVHLATLPAALVTAALGAACLAALGARGRLARADQRAGDAARPAHVPAASRSSPASGSRSTARRPGSPRPPTSSRSSTSSTRSPAASSPGAPDAGFAWRDLRGHRGLGRRRAGRGDAAPAARGEPRAECRTSRHAAPSELAEDVQPDGVQRLLGLDVELGQLAGEQQHAHRDQHDAGDRGDDQVAVAQPAEGGRRAREGDGRQQERDGEAERVEEQQDPALGDRVGDRGGGQDRAERRARRTASRRPRTRRRPAAGRPSRRARSAPPGATRG